MYYDDAATAELSAWQDDYPAPKPGPHVFVYDTGLVVYRDFFKPGWTYTKPTTKP